MRSGFDFLFYVFSWSSVVPWVGHSSFVLCVFFCSSTWEVLRVYPLVVTKSGLSLHGRFQHWRTALAWGMSPAGFLGS